MTLESLDDDLIGVVPRDALELVRALWADPAHWMGETVRVVHDLSRVSAIRADHSEWMILRPGALDPAVFECHGHPTSGGADPADSILLFD